MNYEAISDEDLAKVAGGTDEPNEDEQFEALLQIGRDLMSKFPEKQSILLSIIQSLEDARAAGVLYTDARDRFVAQLLQVLGPSRLSEATDHMRLFY